MDKLSVVLQCLLCRSKSSATSQAEAVQAGWTRIQPDPEECPSCYTGICPACERRTIRLGCVECDRNDFDYITPEELEQAILSGWTGVQEVQSYEESMTPYDPDNTPPGKSITEWETHLGWCPDCQEGT